MNTKNIVLLYHLFIINQISFLLMVILSLRKERNELLYSDFLYPFYQLPVLLVEVFMLLLLIILFSERCADGCQGHFHHRDNYWCKLEAVRTEAKQVLILGVKAKPSIRAAS